MKNSKILYLGLNRQTAKYYHAIFAPIIRIIPKAKSSPSLKIATRYVQQAHYILLTSPTSASLFLSHMLKHYTKQQMKCKHFICIGKTTAKRIHSSLSTSSISVASIETSEGLLPLLQTIPRQTPILYPHSALARPIIQQFLIKKQKTFYSFTHYFPKAQRISPYLLHSCSDIILTSPSIVKAYAEQFPILPNKTYWCQGPISFQAFKNLYQQEPKLLKPLL